MNNSGLNISSKKILMNNSTDIDEESPFYLKTQLSPNKSSSNSKKRIRDIELILEDSHKENGQFEKILDEIFPCNQFTSPNRDNFTKHISKTNLFPKQNQFMSYFSENLQSHESYHKTEEESTLSNLYFNKISKRSFEDQKQELNNFCTSDIEEEDPNLMNDQEIQNIINKKMELLNMYNGMLSKRNFNSFEYR